jgi:chitodextrinase
MRWALLPGRLIEVVHASACAHPVLRPDRKVSIMFRQTAGSLRAARLLQVAVIVAFAAVSLTIAVGPASARRGDSRAPRAPTNLTATAGDSTVGLKWSAATDNVGVTGYRVYRGGSQIGSVSGSTLSYSDSGLANGTTYSYTVKAVDAAGNLSAASNTATATPKATGDGSSPSAPANLTATAGDSTVGLKWSAATDNVGVTGYRVYRSGSQIASVSGSTLGYSDSGLTDGTTYSYTVKAADAAGNLSTASNTATATPSAPLTPSLSTCSSQAFCGDWETGEYSQWWLHQWSQNRDTSQNYTASNVGNSKLTVQTGTVKQGAYAGMFQVLPTTGTSSSDRAEAVASQQESGGYPGQEWYYGWWSYFPSVNGGPQSWWSQGGDWNDITQFQATDDSGGYLHLGVDATSGSARIYLDANKAHYDFGALQYDHWYHFVVHAKWSTDPTVGIFGVTIDGTAVFPDTHLGTLKNTTTAASGMTAPGMYLSQGVYRGAYSSTNTVIHDGFCRAADYATAAAC